MGPVQPLTTKPVMIAIAGPSGSGKTSIARHVARELGGIIFSLDNYYLDLKNIQLDERGGRNFDHPGSLDEAMVVEHLRQLAQGRAIERPIYDFATHTRTDRIERVEPSAHIIVEGLFTLHWGEVRPVYRTKVFVEAGHDVCLPRRLARDIEERGRTEESVLRQYTDTVEPMAERFVLPTKQFADLVLSGMDPVESNARRVLEAVKSN